MSEPEQLPGLDLVPRDQRVWLWEQGYPLHLLYSHQEDLGREFHESDEPEFIVKCGRQFGKSGWTVWEQLTFPMRNQDVIAHYAAPTAKQLKTIMKPHVMRYLADCPEHLRPDVRWTEGEIRYRNGSILYMAGTDSGNAERLRGPRTHQAAVDEASSIAELSYIVDSILSPMTLTTGGRIIMPSTPPVQPAHDFAKIYCVGSEDRRVVHRTVHDARHLRPETVARLCRKAGGEESVSWRREFLALDVFDTEAAVVPEFVKHESEIVRDWKLPKYVTHWVIGDAGFVDLAAYLFVSVDFKAAKVVVQDEMSFVGKATSEQVPALRKREIELWGDDARVTRFVDASPLVRAEYPRTDGGYAVAAADNRDLDATINNLRISTQRGRYVIDPKCRTLIAHLRNATWNKARTAFERVPGFFHFDFTMALAYALKHVSIQANPYPSRTEGLDADNTVYSKPLPYAGQRVSIRRRTA